MMGATAPSVVAPGGDDLSIAERAAHVGVANIVAALAPCEIGPSYMGVDVLPRRSGAGAVAGYALTAWSPAGHNTMTWPAVAACRPGHLLVVSSPDDSVAQWGELATVATVRQRAAGVVVAGAIRDLAGCRLADLSIWARAVNVVDAAKGAQGRLNVPLEVCGVTIRPGDLLVADDDGLTAVPRHLVPGVLTRAERRHQTESAEGRALLGDAATDHIARRADPGAMADGSDQDHGSAETGPSQASCDTEGVS